MPCVLPRISGVRYVKGCQCMFYCVHMYHRCKQKLFLVILVINLLLIIGSVVVIHRKSPFQAGDANLQLQSTDDTKIIVAIGGGITSNKLPPFKASNVAEKFPLFSMLLPSFCRTVANEWQMYVYHFYLAYDVTDPYFSRAYNRRAFETEFNDVIKQYCSLDTISVLHLLECAYTGRPAWAQNDAMITAYLDGADYFYRLNDDTVMSTANWLSSFTSVLLSYHPSNIGVVGPTHDTGNLRILTYDFVHRTHIEIFGFYYPRVFTDWFADDWITYVYAPQHVTKLANVSIKHWSLLGQRYFYDPAKARCLVNQIASDRYTLARYVFHKSHVIAVQKTAMVIAMSLASSDLAELWGVIRNAQLIRVYFPGWTLRVYMKKELAAHADKSIASLVILRLLALGADIVYVDTSLTTISSKWWGYMVADDLDVDFALVRKPNGRLGERDAAAVNAWLRLCERYPRIAVHCIRDSVYQGTRPMMHGLLAVRPRVLRESLSGRSLLSFIRQFVNNNRSYDADGWNPDDFLSQILWPLVQPDAVLCHDSVSRDVWPHSAELRRRTNQLHSHCVGAEYDAHEQLLSACDQVDQPVINVLSVIDIGLEFLV